MNKGKYSHLLFDLDNTILDFDHASHHAFADIVALLELGDREEMYAIYKKINKQVWGDLEKGIISQDEVRSRRWSLFFDKIGCGANPLETNDQYLQNLIKYIQFVPGAQDVLRYFKDQNIVMCIITNGLKEVQRPRIKKAEIDHYFSSIVVSDEISVAKPKPGFFDYVMKEIGNIEKSKCLVVGDTLKSDIKGGNLYGFDTCWYNPKNISIDDDIVPTYTIDKLQNLMNIVIPLQT